MHRLPRRVGPQGGGRRRRQRYPRLLAGLHMQQEAVRVTHTVALAHHDKGILPAVGIGMGNMVRRSRREGSVGPVAPPQAQHRGIGRRQAHPHRRPVGRVDRGGLHPWLRPLPTGQRVVHHRAHRLADGLGFVVVERRRKGDAHRVAVEKHHIESARGGIGARHRGVALVGLVELQLGVGGAQPVPHPPHRTQCRIVLLRHQCVAQRQQTVHPLVGAQRRKRRRVILVAVFPAPRHIEHRLAARRVGIDAVHQLLGIGEHLLLHLPVGKRRHLALLLQHHRVPPPLAYIAHRLVGAMLHKRAPTGGVHHIGQRVAHAAGYLGRHLRQIVHRGVAVAHKQHMLRRLRRSRQRGQTTDPQHNISPVLFQNSIFFVYCLPFTV